MKINIKINIEEVTFIILNFFYWIVIEAYQNELGLLTEESTKIERIISSFLISIMMWFLVYKVVIPIYKIIKNKVYKNVK